MRFRLTDTPWGAARFIFAYLATIVATAIAGLVTIIASPIVNALPTCKADQSGDCGFNLILVIGLVAVFASLFLVAYIFRLTWQWAAWLTTLTLILIEIIIQFSTFTPAWSLLILPVLAALITFERPDRPPSPKKTASRLRLALLLLAFAQFLVWFILLLIS